MSKKSEDVCYRVVVRNTKRELILRKDFSTESDAKEFYNSITEHQRIVQLHVIVNEAMYTKHEKKIY